MNIEINVIEGNDMRKYTVSPRDSKYPAIELWDDYPKLANRLLTSRKCSEHRYYRSSGKTFVFSSDYGLESLITALREVRSETIPNGHTTHSTPWSAITRIARILRNAGIPVTERLVMRVYDSCAHEDEIIEIDNEHAIAACARQYLSGNK